MNPARFIRRQLLSLSGVGLMLGALFFAAALTPTACASAGATRAGSVMLASATK